MKISMAEYRKYADEYLGYCPDCDDFTTDCVEPDARGYQCGSCDGNRVTGAEDAMMMGDVEIVE